MMKFEIHPTDDAFEVVEKTYFNLRHTIPFATFTDAHNYITQNGGRIPDVGYVHPPTVSELVPKVEEWAADRSLLSSDPLPVFKQLGKSLEEFGEMAGALLRDDKSKVQDGIGDVLVTLIILARQQRLSLDECLSAAWDEIKDRTGETRDGVFVKTSDLREKLA